jgi:Sec-independent protein translocase protein TatA
MSKSAQGFSPEININLLPTNKFAEEGVGKFIKWLTTIGRQLIIVTEIIVLIVFGMRFKLDEDTRNLKTSIEEKQKMVQRDQKYEKEIREIQNRLSDIRTLQTSQSSFFNLLNKVSGHFPQHGKLKELGFEKNKVVMSGELLTAESLQALIESFSRSKFFSDLEITSLSTPNSKTPNYSFKATALVVNDVLDTNVKTQGNSE